MPRALPAVSVAIPVRDEEHTLAITLDSLLKQTHRPAEIVVADGGSLDRTREVAASYSSWGVHVLQIGPAFPGRGRNAAIGAASYEWVALIDAGCCADPDWLEQLVSSAARDADVEAVFGDFRPVVETEWERAQALSIVPPRDRRTGLHPPVTVSTLLRKDLWVRVGGFRENLRAAEDLVFFRAITAAGARVARAPGAIVNWRLSDGPAAAYRRLAIYSFHHLAAGLGHTWHLRVMAMDVAGLLLLIGSLRSPMYLALATAAALLRTLRTAWIRRDNAPGEFPWRPWRVLRVGSLLILADLAVWSGGARYLVSKWRR